MTFLTFAPLSESLCSTAGFVWDSGYIKPFYRAVFFKDRMNKITMCSIFCGVVKYINTMQYDCPVKLCIDRARILCQPHLFFFQIFIFETSFCLYILETFYCKKMHGHCKCLLFSVFGLGTGCCYCVTSGNDAVKTNLSSQNLQCFSFDSKHNFPLNPFKYLSGSPSSADLASSNMLLWLVCGACVVKYLENILKVYSGYRQRVHQVQYKYCAVI